VLLGCRVLICKGGRAADLLLRDEVHGMGSLRTREGRPGCACCLLLLSAPSCQGKEGGCCAGGGAAWRGGAGRIWRGQIWLCALWLWGCAGLAVDGGVRQWSWEMEMRLCELRERLD